MLYIQCLTSYSVTAPADLATLASMELVIYISLKTTLSMVEFLINPMLSVLFSGIIQNNQ